MAKYEIKDGVGIIPEGTTIIEEEAFYKCTELKSIVIPDSVTEIGDDAFYNCTSLTNVTIPSSVTKIEGSCTFSGCTHLAGKFVIPYGITKVVNCMFFNCTDLTEVVIPDTVTEIGNLAFADCTGLKNIVIPDSVKEIGDSAFDGCTGLTDIIIGNSVTKIGRHAFYNCTGLTSILIPASVEILNNRWFPDWEVFKGCKNISIKVAEGNPVFDSRDNCHAIIETKKNKLVVGFATTVIPATVVEIGEFAFKGVNIAEIFIHEGIKKIGDMAFELTGVNCIRVAEGNTVYDSRGDCNAIIETGTNSLVMGCSKTIIPDTVTKINSFAFYGCSDLKEIVIPDSVTEIDSYAFSYSGLKSVVIGKKVKYIGEEALECGSLEAITFRGPAPKMSKDSGGCENVFEDCKSVKVINVPVGKSGIYARRLYRGNFPGDFSWEGLLVEVPVEKKSSKK